MFFRLKISENIKKQPWFHGTLSRDAAESLVHMDGEFLVRESAGSKGQYVLTGMRSGTHRHLLLVDPQGKVLSVVFDSEIFFSGENLIFQLMKYF